jgi:putative ABC transport system permease protein
MLRNYLLIALRNIRRQPGFAAINVVGLGVGMAACLLIGLFVWQEQTYDRFHDHAERIFRAWTTVEEGEEAGQRTIVIDVTPPVLAPTLAETFAEVEAVVRVHGAKAAMGTADHRFYESLQFVDPSFFDVFSFRLLQGDPATVLVGTRRVVLSTVMADRFFPGQDAMGQVLPINLDGEMRPYVVTGIIEKPPVTSSLQYGVLIPFADWEALVDGPRLTSWHLPVVQSYVLAREGVSRAELEEQFPSLVRRVISSEQASGYAIHLQPITDLRLGETLPDSHAPVAYRQYLSLLAIIALFVLVVAAINFVTLSLGQSTRRSREVGLRKTLGARRGQVAGQFWGEALMLTALALGLGVGMAWLLSPAFSTLAGVKLAFGLGPRTVGIILLLLAVVGLGAGAYPALVLSGFGPIEALKGRLQISGDRSLLRRGLVVVQFSMAILLIIGTLLVNRQLDFMRTAPLGFDEEQAVVIPTGMGWTLQPVLERFRDLLSDHASVRGVSASAFAIGEIWARAGFEDAEGTWRTFRMNWNDPDFLAVAGVELAAGRMLDASLASDSMRIIVNQALVRDYGWASAEEAVGRSLPGPALAPLEIVGVVQDFHFASLRNDIEPLVYTMNPHAVWRGASDMASPPISLRKLIVRIASTEVPATLATLRQTWERAAPDAPFDYFFLDEAIQAQYVQEARLARIASTASVLAILMAALGLFALATLSVTRRRKEVGVRKVLGASTAGLVALLSKDFLKLVAVAFVIAAPLAHLGVSRWLESFAYRIEPGVGVFVLAGAAASLIAFLAVSYHALRAATADPVKAFRAEG